MKMTTLCYIENEEQYLMLHRIKKENDYNKDKWIGVGGKFKEDESPEECLLREVYEETHLILTEYQFRGIVTFVSDEYETEYMYLYTATKYEGKIGVCEEGALEWVNKSDIEHLNIWQGDRLFLNLLRENAPCFSLKLCYRGNELVAAKQNGKALEFFDLRTKNGEMTGHVKERSLVHQDGDLHATAHVWIIRPKKDGSYDVLLQKRSQTKDSFPSCYDISSAGHLPAGSDYLESALRELGEELGIHASEDDLTMIGWHEANIDTEFYGRQGHNHEISQVFVYDKYVDIDKLLLQAEEVDSVQWFDLEECIHLLKEHKIPNCIFLDEMELLKNYILKKN